MNDTVPIYEGKPLSDHDEKLDTLFSELEKGQLEFLDQAGKRIIELVTALLGVLFAIIAFGKDFPPAYLAGNNVAKGLMLGAVFAYFLALLFALLMVQPRRYRYYPNNITRTEDELGKMMSFKVTGLRIAGGLFFIATFLLVLLIALIIVTA